jgi:hypothetical protein
MEVRGLSKKFASYFGFEMTSSKKTCCMNCNLCLHCRQEQGDKTDTNMANLKSRIDELATSFVEGVLRTLATASLAELSQLDGAKGRAAAAVAVVETEEEEPRRRGRRPGRRPKAAAPAPRPAAPAPAPAAARSGGGRRSGRRARRSSEDVEHLAEQVVSYVRTSGGNVAVSDIAKALGVGTAEVNRPVVIALTQQKIYKTGEKRLTRYYPIDGDSDGGGRRGRRKKG